MILSLTIYLSLLLTIFCNITTLVEVVQVYINPALPEPVVDATGQNEVTTEVEFNATFATEILNTHNSKRAIHGAQPLVWNSSLFNFAADFTSKYNCSGILRHSGDQYGENLAIGYSTIGAVDAWYNEGSTYLYDTELVYNHFTQLVWNNTYAIGCAYKYCNPVWGTYIACSYYPSGNIVGQSKENVFRPIYDI